MIRGTVGLGGRGKTYTTVQRLWRLHRHFGREVFSNTPLVDLRVCQRVTPNGVMWCPVNAETFGESWAAGYVTRFQDIYSLDNCEVLLDEVGTWMHKTEWNKMPMEVRQFLTQDRREGVNVWWTYRTTRVYFELWDNTGELTRCVRYGPFVFMTKSDPEAPDERPTREVMTMTQAGHDLYDTFFRVGDGTGQGYGQGKRVLYGQGGRARFVYHRQLETVSGSFLECRIPLRPEQVAVMVRKFGPDSVGLVREQHPVGAVRYRHAP